MFGLFKKKFDAEKHLTIAVTRGGQPLEKDSDVPPGTRVRVVSTGLAAWKRPELEVVDVPLELVRSAAALINLVANSCANERAIASGETWGATLGGCLLSARAFTVEGRLRLVDPERTSADESAPRLCLTTLAFLRGLSAVEDEREAAVAQWNAAVAFFPGAPSRAAMRTQQGAIINDENFLCWLALARHDDDEKQPAHYREAMLRSVDLLRAEFGATTLPDDDGGEAVRQLLHELHETELGVTWGPERMRSEGLKGAELMTLVPSPLLEPREEGLVQSMSVMCFPFRRYFYESPVREQLHTPEVRGLISELYRAAVAAPERVLSLTLETRNLYLPALGPEWLFSDDAAPLHPMPLSGPRWPALSRLLADVGRRLAAGLSVDEVRALYGLRDDPALVASAQQKMSALRDEEGALMLRSLGLEAG